MECPTTCEPQRGRDGQDQAGEVPATIGSVHDRPDGVVRLPHKLDNGGHEQTGQPRQYFRLKASIVNGFGVEGCGPSKTLHPYGESNGAEAVHGVGRHESQETDERQKVDDSEVSNDQASQGRDGKQERRDGRHNKDLVAGDAHIPEREIPDKDSQAGEDGPKDVAVVHISHDVEGLIGAESQSRDTCCSLLLLFFKLGRGDERVVGTRIQNMFRTTTDNNIVFFAAYVCTQICTILRKKIRGFLNPEDLLRKPLDIPLANSFYVPNHHFEGIEIQGGHGIECDIEEDEGPLEEGVGRVG